MKEFLTLYHGSIERIAKPELNKIKILNDFGPGFYCTEHYDLACEWASKKQRENGYVNKYELYTKDLKLLDLTTNEYNILNWMTLLIKNRTFDLRSPISVEAKEYLIENFSVDTSVFDFIKGYRADDSYFSFAEDFLNNTISVERLSRAMKLGDLSIQFALISHKAFNNLCFKDADEVDNDKYYNLYRNRDQEARNKYRDDKKNLKRSSDELFVVDIIRKEIRNGDPRIQ